MLWQLTADSYITNTYFLVAYHENNFFSVVLSHLVNFTVRIRRVGRFCFHRCLSVQVVGTLVQGSFPGIWSQVLSGGTPVLVGSTPVLVKGTSVLARGYPSDIKPLPPPQPGQDWGIPTRTVLGYWDWGTSLRQDWGTPPPPRQNSRASTCYVAGGMPLAFMQEDF